MLNCCSLSKVCQHCSANKHLFILFNSLLTTLQTIPADHFTESTVFHYLFLSAFFYCTSAHCQSWSLADCIWVCCVFVTFCLCYEARHNFGDQTDLSDRVAPTTHQSCSVKTTKKLKGSQLLNRSRLQTSCSVNLAQVWSAEQQQIQKKNKDQEKRVVKASLGKHLDIGYLCVTQLSSGHKFMSWTMLHL